MILGGERSRSQSDFCPAIFDFDAPDQIHLHQAARHSGDWHLVQRFPYLCFDVCGIIFHLGYLILLRQYDVYC